MFNVDIQLTKPLKVTTETKNQIKQMLRRQLVKF